jgi:hypothetical protein
MASPPFRLTGYYRKARVFNLNRLNSVAWTTFHPMIVGFFRVLFRCHNNRITYEVFPSCDRTMKSAAARHNETSQRTAHNKTHLSRQHRLATTATPQRIEATTGCGWLLRDLTPSDACAALFFAGAGATGWACLVEKGSGD